MRWNGYLEDPSGSADPKYFGTPPANVERFQPIPANATYEFVETSYFGFNIPEHAIDCVIYLWFHRTLGVASGGIVMWQGMKPVGLSTECRDWQHFMPLPTDLTDQSYPSGLRIKQTDNEGEFLIEYHDSERNTHLHLLTKPAMPLAIRPTGNHFTQVMRTKGELVLRGKSYTIDGYHARDRTWSEPRTERPLSMPPITWTVGTFGDQMSFHIMGYDSSEHHPEWKGVYPLGPGENHLWGYVYRDGRLVGITATDKQTLLQPDGITPKGYKLTIHDAEGEQWNITGTPIALTPCDTWETLTVIVTLNRWECNGMVGYGDAQEVLYGDHIGKFLK